MTALWCYLPCSNGLTVISTEEFRSLRLAFSPNLDDYNPDIPEWRRDISRVIKKSLVEVSTSIAFSHETESFPDLEWLHGEQTPCKGRRRQSWSPKQISVWYLNICEPFMHAYLHYWVSAALRNIWPLPPVKLILLQEGHGYL